MPLVILGSAIDPAHAPLIQQHLDEWSKWGDNYMGERIEVTIDDDFAVEEGREYVIQWYHTKDQRRDIEWQISACLSDLKP
jgi:hypothetical protein